MHVHTYVNIYIYMSSYAFVSFVDIFHCEIMLSLFWYNIRKYVVAVRVHESYTLKGLGFRV